MCLNIQTNTPRVFTHEEYGIIVYGNDFANVKPPSGHGHAHGDATALVEPFALLRGSVYIFVPTSTQSGKSQKGQFPYRVVAWQPGESRSRHRDRAGSRLGSPAG